VEGEPQKLEKLKRAQEAKKQELQQRNAVVGAVFESCCCCCIAMGQVGCHGSERAAGSNGLFITFGGMAMWEAVKLSAHPAPSWLLLRVHNMQRNTTSSTLFIHNVRVAHRCSLCWLREWVWCGCCCFNVTMHQKLFQLPEVVPDQRRQLVVVGCSTVVARCFVLPSLANKQASRTTIPHASYEISVASVVRETCWPLDPQSCYAVDLPI
jgi:hypothetical protein